MFIREDMICGRSYFGKQCIFKYGASHPDYDDVKALLSSEVSGTLARERAVSN